MYVFSSTIHCILVFTSQSVFFIMYRSVFEHGLNDRMYCTGSRVTNYAFLKRRNASLCCAQRPLSITSLWGQKKEENPDDAAKKVNDATIFFCLSKHREVMTLIREILFV